MRLPTERTLQEIRKRGGIAGVVERYNRFAKKRFDLFGAIDIIAILFDPFPIVVGIQTTSGSHHAARVTAARDNKALDLWIKAGARFEVWSWSERIKRNKDGRKSKRKAWTVRITKQP